MSSAFAVQTKGVLDTEFEPDVELHLIMDNYGEFATAVKYKLPIKVVVLKNDHYSRIMSEDNALGIPPFGTELQPIDFVRFAEACGGVGFACARPEDVGPALEAAWRIADRPALVEATIDNDADVSPPDDYLSSLKGA